MSPGTTQFCYIGPRIGWVSALLYYHIINHQASNMLTRQETSFCSLIILPILSTCPLNTNINSGRGNREAHIIWSMVTCKMAAHVTGTTLRTTGPVRADSGQ